MEAVNERAAAVLDYLTDRLVEPDKRGESYKRFEGEVPIDVERTGTFTYTITHYTKDEHGTILQDPQLEVFAIRRSVVVDGSAFEKGDWVPLSLDQSDGAITSVDRIHGDKPQHLVITNTSFHEKHIKFANRWLEQIAHQLKLRMV